MQRLNQNKIIMLRPEQIRTARYQPRKDFDEGELKKLAESISMLGMAEPITVRRVKKNYEIVFGERRLRAAVMAGLRRVPCIVYKIDERQAVFFSVVNSLQQKSLNCFELAKSINNLIIRYRLSIKEAALKLGINENELSNKLKILRLDEALQRKIIAANLGEEYAILLLKVDEFSREEILGIIISEGLNIAQAEQLIEDIENPKEEKREEDSVSVNLPPIRKNLIEDTRILTNSLEKLMLTVEDSMMNVEFKKNESSKFIEYRFKIKKGEEEIPSAKQLKIC